MVPRCSFLRAAMAAVTLTVGVLLGSPADATDHTDTDLAAASSFTAPPEYDAPLLITIDELTPGSLGDRGRVVVEGRIANRDVVPWQAISIYPFFNPDQPITTSGELAEAAEAPPEAVVGDRITEVSDSVEELEPGEVATYRLRVPRNLLRTSTAGVYWFGVHASGESESTARDGFTDGRARTFLPYVPDATRGSVDTAMVVPLRRRIVHTAAGAIARKEAWENALGEQGNLGRLLGFASSSFGRPVSWLVDPALLDVLRRLSRGNPPRSLGPTAQRGDDQPEEPTGSDEPSRSGGGPAEVPSPEETEEGPGAEQADPMAVTAEEWLGDLEGQLRGEEVLALPYGDLDVAAAADHLPEVYERARDHRGQQLEEWGVETVPVVASPTGYLDAEGFDVVDDGALVMVTDRMFTSDSRPSEPPRAGVYDGSPVAVTSSGASTGGPGPDPRLAPVAFRQRVLAEAALRLVADGPAAPLVVMVPPRVDPVDADEFWTGLDAPWLELTTVEDTVDRRRRTVRPETLAYPEEQVELELGASVFSQLQTLVHSGETLQNVLTDDSRVASDVLAEALTAASYSSRSAPYGATVQLARSGRWITDRLEAIRISAPPGVTMSSADGSIPVTITNRLRVPVTVSIRAESEEGLTVDVGKPVSLGPRSRSTVVLDAHTRGLGVRNVTFSLVDSDGTPLGATDRVPIRSNQVGSVIWWVLGTGCGILLLAIVVRLVRRFRAARRPAPAPGPAAPDGAGEAVPAGQGGQRGPAGQAGRPA